jgi:hypothetical protein
MLTTMTKMLDADYHRCVDSMRAAIYCIRKSLAQKIEAIGRQ